MKGGKYMKLFFRMFNSNDNLEYKEIDMRLFFKKNISNELPLPPFTKHYHFSYVKRDY